MIHHVLVIRKKVKGSYPIVITNIFMTLSLLEQNVRLVISTKFFYSLHIADYLLVDNSSSTCHHSSTPSRSAQNRIHLKNFTITNKQILQNTIGENFGGVNKVATHQFTLDETPDQTGKVAVVTGGSEGIGYGVTYTLLKHNISKVFILSVSPEVVQGAKEAVGKDLGKDKADRTEWLKCDLTDWNETKSVAEKIRSSTDRLDILVNNAGRGIMTFQLTDYGVDRHMALNHMGHVVLTSHLLPLLKKTAEEKNTTVRIVNQASNAHQAAPSSTKFESLEELNQDLGPNGQYGRSKLANILYARYFDRKVTKGGFPNVLMNATHPGFVSTKMSKDDIHEP